MRLFYSLKSPLYWFIILSAIVLWSYRIYQSNPLLPHIDWFFLIYSACNLMMLCFALIPWSGLAYKGLGVDDHFEKIASPFMIIWLLQGIFPLEAPLSDIINGAFSVLMGIFLIINFILLSYHFKDKDPTPPGYFGANLYLKDQ